MTSATRFEKLCAAPHRYDAATALRIAQAEASARGVPVMVSGQPATGLHAHPVTQVAAFEDRVEICASMFNLVGPLSPLPLSYTETAARQHHRRARGITAFYDLFSHRLTWLFVRASERYNLAALLQWERPAHNAILQALRALIGFGSQEANQQAPLPHDQTLRFAGLLAQRTRNATGLEAMLCAQLQLPVKVAQFHHTWRPVPESEQSRANGLACLGKTAMAGSRVPSRAEQIRVVIGPVRYVDFVSLREGSPRMEQVQGLVRLYVGPVLDFDIQLILDRRDIPQTQLTQDAPASLGWNTWLAARERQHHSGAAILRPRGRSAGQNHHQQKPQQETTA